MIILDMRIDATSPITTSRLNHSRLTMMQDDAIELRDTHTDYAYGEMAPRGNEVEFQQSFY